MPLKSKAMEKRSAKLEVIPTPTSSLSEWKATTGSDLLQSCFELSEYCMECKLSSSKDWDSISNTRTFEPSDVTAFSGKCLRFRLASPLTLTYVQH